jgi:WD40 repeat protein
MANPTNFSFDVFLSHNSRDKARVRRLAERLRGAGVRVWFDEWVIRPGDDIYLNVERGLEAARTLVLCLSPAALGSDWVGLERSTVLFRDPSNAARRFIPLLLADCDLPDAIRRYKYVDFREEAEPAFEELLTACRPAEEQGPPTPRPEPEERAKVRKKPKLDDSPVVLERRLAGHRGFVNSVAVSKDGKWVVSGSDDGTVRIWDIETGISQATPGGHGAQVKCIAITPDGKKLLSCSHDRTIKTWAFPSGRLERVLKVHEDLVRPVVLVADGEMLLSGDQGDAGSIKLWVTDSAECTKTIQAGESVRAAALSGDRKRLLIGGHKGKVVLWDLGAGQNLATMKQHADRV